MIHSYNKNLDALFLKFIFIKNYMFRTNLLSSIRSLNTVDTAMDISHASYGDCASEAAAAAAAAATAWPR